MGQRAKRWRSTLGVVLMASSFVWLGPSSAAPASVEYRALASSGEAGAWAVREDGSFVSLGDAPAAAPKADSAEVVDVAVPPAGTPVVLRNDGSVVQLGGLTVTCPKVSRWWEAAGVALTPDGKGAWVAAVNGQVVNCGTAEDLSPGQPPSLDAPVVAIAATGTAGYVLLTASGEVLSYGSARRSGRGTPEGSRFVSLATTEGGYWLARADGVVQAFGTAAALGGVERTGVRVVDIATTPSRKGYRLLAATGEVFTFGDLPVLANGSIPAVSTLVDDSFEGDSDGWATWWGAPEVARTTDARTGAGALAMPGRWDAFGNATRTVDGLAGGRTYRLSYWVKGGATVGGEFNWSTPSWSRVVSDGCRRSRRRPSSGDAPRSTSSRPPTAAACGSASTATATWSSTT